MTGGGRQRPTDRNEQHCYDYDPAPFRRNNTVPLFGQHARPNKNWFVRRKVVSSGKLYIIIPFLVVLTSAFLSLVVLNIQQLHRHESSWGDQITVPWHKEYFLGQSRLHSKNRQRKSKTTAVYPKDEHVDASSLGRYVLTAYMEPVYQSDWNRTPLPLRRPSTLTTVTYPQLQSCSKFLEQFPVEGDVTDRDPFLPWIHDVFPTGDGQFVYVVAQNRRRCRLGPQNQQWMDQLLPQQALFQNIPVQRFVEKNQTRYRLSDYDHADPDSYMTRFICRFLPSQQESLSVFDFDYDWMSYRKRFRKGFTKEEGQIKQIHTSQLIFKCPVPSNLQQVIRSGSSVVDDYATLFLEIVPIRTPPRWGNPQQFLQPMYSSFTVRDPEQQFNASRIYGTNHVLPLIKDSGRWSNIPICLPSELAFPTSKSSPSHAASPRIQSKSLSSSKKKPYRLSACIWASTEYSHRGNSHTVNDGQRRLKEWITYHKMVGIQHFYLYDNSMSITNKTSLVNVAGLFPDDVTYISWPAKICNNNEIYHKSPGERSSQYAAESSCRLRFGSQTDWIAQLDIDEYIVPMGNYSSILELLDDLEKEDTRVLSFASVPALPRRTLLQPLRISDPNVCQSTETCFEPKVSKDLTYLQTYNCDPDPPGAKQRQDPAEKQIYRSDYVLQHFVHYSAVTRLTSLNRTLFEREGFRWKGRAEDPHSRFSREESEAIMIHARSLGTFHTAGYERICRATTNVSEKGKSTMSHRTCVIGTPWPLKNKTQEISDSSTTSGFLYNCYINEKVENVFVPKLEEHLRRLDGAH